MKQEPIPKKTLGQHWLHDAASLRSIVAAAELSNNDTVVEVGPGLGTLTHELVAAAGHVVAIELDDRLFQELPVRVPAPNLEVIHADILAFDFTTLSAGYKVVANIPYYLTSHLIRVLSETTNPPACVVLLVQKEVAERVAAHPGDMSLLAVTAQYYNDIGLGPIVPARLFVPPPKVDSRVLVLTRRTAPLFGAIDTRKFFQLVKAGFSQRRKTLLNSLGAGLHLDREAAAQLLERAHIQSNTRAQALSLDDWYRLYQNA